jgi:hypothetical protein
VKPPSLEEQLFRKPTLEAILSTSTDDDVIHSSQRIDGTESDTAGSILNKEVHGLSFEKRSGTPEDIHGREGGSTANDTRKDEGLTDFEE